MCDKLSPPRRVDRFAWNFGGIHNSTRAIAWGTFQLPVGSPNRKWAFLPVKPILFRHHFFPRVNINTSRVDWVTFQYRLNRKYRLKTRILTFFIKSTIISAPNKSRWIETLFKSCESISVTSCTGSIGEKPEVRVFYREIHCKKASNITLTY